MILLREIDPSFETPASNNIVYQNLWSIIIGFPMLLLMGYVARSTTWSLICLGVMAVLMTLMLLVILRDKLKKGKATDKG